MNNFNMQQVWVPSENMQPHNPCGQGTPGIPAYPIISGYDTYNQVMAMEKAALDMEKVRAREAIITKELAERKAKSLDLQTKHENRRVEVLMNYEGTPILGREMLAEEPLKKCVADISRCAATILVPAVIKVGDKIQRIMWVKYYDNVAQKKEDFTIDITVPDDKSFLKKIRAKGIRLLCGQRKQLEYAGKLLDGLERIAKEVKLPRERGFTVIESDEGLKIDYVSESETTWEEIIDSWV